MQVLRAAAVGLVVVSAPMLACGGGAAMSDAPPAPTADAAAADASTADATPCLPPELAVATPGAPVTCDDVLLYPNVQAVGVHLAAPPVDTTTVTLRYRRHDACAWATGQPLAAMASGGFAGSLFWLTPETTYAVELTARDSAGAALTTTTCVVATDADLLPSPVASTIYVDASAAPGGDGSLAAPLATIQAGVAAAEPGDLVRVAAGTYYEEVSIPRSGLPGAFVRITGEPGAVIDGSDPAIASAGLGWTADGATANVYRAPLATTPVYLARDDLRFYKYDDLTALRAGLGHDQPIVGWVVQPVAEGWVVDGGFLYVRTLTDPASHVWHVPVPSHARGFYVGDRDHVWIEGFTISFHEGPGVYLLGSSNNVVRGNTFLHDRFGVWVADRGDGVADRNRIEGNDLADPPVGDWNYFTTKYTTHENSAVVLQAGHGNLVRGNRVHDFHDGLKVGDNVDLDLYANVVRHVVDDGVEADGAGSDVRVWGNAFDDVLTGLSLAPVTRGPVWIIGNRFTAFTGRGAKIGGGVDGVAFIYQNTFWTDVPGVNGMEPATDDSSRLVFRNNIFRATRYGFAYGIATPGLDYDHDDWFSPAAPLFRWSGVDYASTAALCTAVGQECHGASDEPGLVDPAGGHFGVAGGSVNVDRAVPLPGINDGFVGAGPDRGYLEVGGVDPVFGPAF